jgi:hypothetical protein
MSLLAAKSPLLPILVFLALVVTLARMRARVRVRPPSRARLLVGGAFCSAGAIFLAKWGPPRIPDTPGSPAALVFWLVLISFVGMFALSGVVMLVWAALRGRREQS